MKRLALAALLLATPASAEEFTVMLDWFVNPDHGPIIVAQEKGYFAEQGLEVTIIPPADPADPPKMAAAGRADLAVSYQPQLHLMVAEGLPLRRVGTLIGTPLNCLLVLEDGPVQSVADLRGKRIGFSVSGIHEALIGAILGDAGMTPQDVELVNVNWSLSPALMSGQVDAVIGAFRNFELNQMQIEGRPGRCFPVEEVGVPSYEELVYVANPDTMDADAIARFLSATEKATADIIADPEAAWQAFSATAPELQDELNARAWVDTVPFFAPHPAELHADRYTAFSAFLAEAGLIPAPQPVETVAITLPPVAE